MNILKYFKSNFKTSNSPAINDDNRIKIDLCGGYLIIEFDPITSTIKVVEVNSIFFKCDLINKHLARTAYPKFWKSTTTHPVIEAITRVDLVSPIAWNGDILDCFNIHLNRRNIQNFKADLKRLNEVFVHTHAFIMQVESEFKNWKSELDLENKTKNHPPFKLTDAEFEAILKKHF